MNKQLLTDNLRFAKRTVKGVPDQLRRVAGYALRPFEAAPPFTPIGAAVDGRIEPYRNGSTRFPVSIVTPATGHFMTTFFDVDPFSPSGRFLAVTQVPFINRIPLPGDPARVCVIDLADGGRCTSVYETVGWGAQLGANVQWGSTDELLFCNDFINGRGVGVRIDLASGTSTALDGPVYGTDPARAFSYGPNLQLVNAIIPGYGVPDPLIGKKRQNVRASADEGIWRTDLATGRSDLLVSLADIVPRLDQQEGVAGGRYYVFNVKVNAQNDRLFAVLFSRRVPGRIGWPVQLVTMKLDGSDVKVAMPDALWRVGGHHPSWAPDGRHIVMNLRRKGEKMAFVRFRADGGGLEVIAPGHIGGGHPSLHPSQRWLLTDAYTSEGFKNAEGEVPIRLIDLDRSYEEEVCRVYTKEIDGPRRVDPHPVWSADGKRMAFNAVLGGMRQVLVATMPEH